MLCWGSARWGARRLLSHVAALPRDSAYVLELQGPSAYWDERVELAAQLVDAIRIQSFYLLKINGNDPQEPTPIPRPGAATARAGSLADFNAFLIGG